MRHLTTALARFQKLVESMPDDDVQDDDLILVHDAESDLAYLRRTLAEALQYVDVEDPRDDEFTVYRRRDLIRRLRRIV